METGKYYPVESLSEEKAVETLGFSTDQVSRILARKEKALTNKEEILPQVRSFILKYEFSQGEIEEKARSNSWGQDRTEEEKTQSFIQLLESFGREPENSWFHDIVRKSSTRKAINSVLATLDEAEINSWQVFIRSVQALLVYGNVEDDVVSVKTEGLTDTDIIKRGAVAIINCPTPLIGVQNLKGCSIYKPATPTPLGLPQFKSATQAAAVVGLKRILSGNILFPEDAIWISCMDPSFISSRVNSEDEIAKFTEAQALAFSSLLLTETKQSQIFRLLTKQRKAMFERWLELVDGSPQLLDSDSDLWVNMKKAFGSFTKLPMPLSRAYKKVLKNKPKKKLQKQKRKKSRKGNRPNASERRSPATSETEQTAEKVAATIVEPTAEVTIPAPEVIYDKGELENWLINASDSTPTVVAEIAPGAVLQAQVFGETFNLGSADSCSLDGIEVMAEHAGSRHNIGFSMWFPETDQRSASTSIIFYLRPPTDIYSGPEEELIVDISTLVADEPEQEEARQEEIEYSPEQENFLELLLEFCEDLSNLVEKVRHKEGGTCEILLYEAVGKLFPKLQVPDTLVIKMAGNSLEVLEPAIGIISTHAETNEEILSNFRVFLNKRLLEEQARETSVKEVSEWREKYPNLSAQLTHLRKIAQHRPLSFYNQTKNGNVVYAWDQYTLKGGQTNGKKLRGRLERFVEQDGEFTVDFETDQQKPSRGLSAIRVNFNGYLACLKLDLENKPLFEVEFTQEDVPQKMQQRVRDFLVGTLHLLGQFYTPDNDLYRNGERFGEIRLKQVNIKAAESDSEKGEDAEVSYGTRHKDTIERFNLGRGRMIPKGIEGQSSYGNSWADLILSESHNALVIQSKIIESDKIGPNVTAKRFDIMLGEKSWQKYFVIRLWKALGWHRTKTTNSEATPISSGFKRVFDEIFFRDAQTLESAYKDYEHVNPAKTDSAKVEALIEVLGASYFLQLSEEEKAAFAAINSPTKAIDFRVNNQKGEDVYFIEEVLRIAQTLGIRMGMQEEPTISDAESLLAIARESKTTIRMTQAEYKLVHTALQPYLEGTTPLKIEFRD